MTRGKSAARNNAALRDQLAEAASARRRLETRLKEAEIERDLLAERVAKVEKHDHPAIEAERMRADAARNRETQIRAEADQTIERCLLLIIEGLGRAEVKPDLILTQEEWMQLRKLAGPKAIVAIMQMAGTELNRTQRRNFELGPEKLSRVWDAARETGWADPRHAL